MLSDPNKLRFLFFAPVYLRGKNKEIKTGFPLCGSSAFFCEKV